MSKSHAKGVIAHALSALSDAQRRQTIAVLEAHSARMGTGGLTGDAAKLEQITRYLQSVAKAENAARGRAAGSARALPGSTCMTVAAALCVAVRDGAKPADAHNAQRAAAGMSGGAETTHEPMADVVKRLFG
jgi:hypothetical protein